MRRFIIYRTAELAQGIQQSVAEGITFSDGTAVVHWQNNPVSMTLLQASSISALYGPERVLTIRWLDKEALG